MSIIIRPMRIVCNYYGGSAYTSNNNITTTLTTRKVLARTVDAVRGEESREIIYTTERSLRNYFLVSIIIILLHGRKIFRIRNICVCYICSVTTQWRMPLYNV